MNSPLIKISSIFLFLFVVTLGFSQNLNMVNGSYTRCNGTFYDPGGTGNYANNQNIITTICPGTPGSSLRVSFTSFATEQSFDDLTIYNGNSTAAPVLGTYDGTLVPFTVQANNPTGCLTFEFYSDGSGVEAGWVATMACIFPCQPITATVSSSTPALVAGVIDMCVGQPLTVTGSGNYTAPTQLYPQSNANCSFTWDLGDGNFSSGQTVTYTYPQAGVYNLDLRIKDINDCDNSNDINVLVRVSDLPSFAGTNVASPSICLGQTNTLSGFAQGTEIEYFCASSFPDTTFIPDGIGVPYSTSINLDCFDAGTTIVNASDINSICLDMEHSYINDLELTITCPNGTTIDLYYPPLTGLNSVFLGEPVDNDASLTMGDPYTYCFTMSATQSWLDVVDPVPPPPLGTIPTYTFVDNDGVTQTNKYYVPAGNYLPDQSFAGLAGCPLNGDWTITVTDGLSDDNGTIFNWSIDFDPSLYSVNNNYTPALTDTMWLADPTITSTINDVIIVTPTSIGNKCYTYRATDEFGCDYDTVICFNVVPGEDPTFSYSQAGYCTNAADPTPTITGLAGGTFTSSPAGLSINASSGQINLAASTPGVYTVTYTTPGVGCQTSLDQTVAVNNIPGATLSGGGTICQGQSTTVQIDFTGGSPWDVVYNDGTANNTVTGITTSPYVITTGTAGSYSLVSVSNPACSGTVSGTASVVVNQNVSFSNVTATCDAGNTSYVVTFNLNGGDPGSYAVTGMGGGTITNPSAGVYLFTSAAIPAGSPNYTFNFSDANACNTPVISGTQNCNCNASASISGGGSICPGDSALLTVSFVGTGPFDFTYTNSNGSTTYTSVASPFSFYDSIPGSYSLTNMSDATCSGSVGGSGNIVVNPNPTVSVPDATICSGANTNLTATPSTSGGSYAWSPGAFGNSQTINVSPATSQYFYVTYTLNGCSGMDSSFVTVNPVPVVNAIDSSICNGGSADVNTTVDIAGGTYSWMPGGETTSSINVSPTTTTSYTVTYTFNGCSTSDVATVTVSSQPTISVNDVTICAGESAVLTGTVNNAGGSFSWQSPPSPAGSTGSSITVSPNTTTYFPVTYSIGTCSAIDSGLVTVKYAPTVNVADTSICEGNSATLTAMVDSTGGSYNWSPGSFSAIQQITVSPSVTTTYQVVYSLGGCTDTSTSIVTVTPSPSVTVNSETICFGDSVEIIATPSQAGGTYSWDYMGATTQSIWVSPTTQTNYNVLYDINGCQTNGGGTVTVTPLPNTVASSNSPVCEGMNINMGVLPNGGQYQWSGPNAFSSTNQSPNINSCTLSDSGQYVVSVTVNGCSQNDTITVQVNSISADFTEDVNQGCAPLDVTFTNITTNSVNCTWDFGDNSNDNTCGPVTHQFITPGTYSLTLTVTDANGCTDQMTKTNLIYIEASPIVDFVPTPSELSSTNATTMMDNLTTGAVNYMWYFPGGSTSTDFEPSVDVDFGGNERAEITLYAFSPLGCVDSLMRIVTRVEDVVFYIPNSFTPDGDPLNHYFQPVMTAGFDPDTYIMEIYNRWGEKVFETRDINIGWDGTYGGSDRLVPEDVYTYRVRFLLKETDERRDITGHLNLMR